LRIYSVDFEVFLLKIIRRKFMKNSGGRLLSSLTLGSTLIGLGYYLSTNKKLTKQISSKLKDSFSTLSDNSSELKDLLVDKFEDGFHTFSDNSHEIKDKLLNKFEKRLNNLSDDSHEIKDRLMDKFEKRLNSLTENSQDIQNELLSLVKDTRHSLNHVLKDTKSSLSESVELTGKQFSDIVSRLAPALIIKPKRSGGFMRGLSLGGTLLGLGYYLVTNKKLSDQITTKVKEMLETYKVEDKLMHAASETKSSLSESMSKTGKQMGDTFNRLTTAFLAGRAAARDSLNKTKTENNKNTKNIRDSAEKPLGATEDTSTDNTSPTLHPVSNNVAQGVGDAGTNFDRISSGKKVSDK
jgi:formiminotetrahydrofolate cyclodeaminase